MGDLDKKLSYEQSGVAGTFWTRMLDDASKAIARSITESNMLCPTLEELDVAVRELSGDNNIIVRDIPISIKPDNVLFVGDDLTSYWATEYDGVPLSFKDGDKPEIALALSDIGVVYVDGEGFGTITTDDIGREPILKGYYVPIPKELHPNAIRSADSKGKVFINCIDFHVRPGFVVFRRNPIVEVGTTMIISSANFIGSAPYNYTYNAPTVMSNTRRVADYARRYGDVKSLELATASAAGIFISEVDDTVLESYTTRRGVRYIFRKQGIVNVDYPHGRLLVGATVKKDEIVHDTFSIWHADKDMSWIADAIEGAVLDYVLPVKGIISPPGNIPVILEDAQTKRVNILLEGDMEAVRTFNEIQHRKEIRTGVYLADKLHLTEATPSKDINFLELLHEAFAGRLIVARIGTFDVRSGIPSNARIFLEENRPINTGLILI